ncbi:MAG: hypothetical protein WBA93_36540 [Microcoleaceae cyanobacterium]
MQPLSKSRGNSLSFESLDLFGFLAQRVDALEFEKHGYDVATVTSFIALIIMLY